MKKTWTLRRQLNILLALIVIFQSLALVFALFISRVYFMLDAEAVRLLNNTTETRAETFDTSVGQMIAGLADESKQLSTRMTDLAQQTGSTPQAIYRDDIAYNESAQIASDALVSILKQDRVTGAFFILNGSNAEKANGQAHSAVYIRNTTPDSEETANYSLEIGPTAVAKSYGMATSIRWDLDMKENEDGSQFDFYEKPFWAGTAYKGSEIERFGYWTKPIDLLKDNQQVVCYTLPVLDQDGNPYGVLGVEIDMPYFSQYYLPDSDLLYHNSFYVIAGMHDQALDLNWFIPGGVLAKTYLKSGEQLPMKALKDEGISETTLNDLGAMYSSMRELKVYSENSPFVDENWTLACFVPSQVLMENSQSVREKLFASIAITTLLAFSGVFVLVYFFTRKISRLSEYVSGLSPYDEIQFKPTGMREIDDLTSAVELFNQSLVTASQTTSKILELSLLPIGGYEVLDSSRNVILTDFLYWLLHIEPGIPVSKEEWKACLNRLRANPMEDHANIYRYDDEQRETQLWLRIIEAKQPSGVVGVVQDVSTEIEENRRLVNELDYDALTHLYSRTALKREVNRKLREKPDKIGAMIFMDLDNLKYINDSFGHEVGDRLIVRAGEIFRYFEPFGGIISRISGDEFAVYLHDFDHPDQVRDIIREFHDQKESFCLRTPDGESRRIRFSSGIAWYPQDADNVTELLKLSDFAMYEAKNTEKGRLFEFNREYYEQTLGEHKGESTDSTEEEPSPCIC